MADREFAVQLSGFSLTTAEIFYHMPDYPAVLQAYIWQDYDLAPQFPKLKQFLRFWQGHLDGAVHGVRVAHRRLISPAEFRFVDGKLVLH
jgi:uncharacterized protein Usg